MKKLSITDIKATEILSVEEKKMVVGGQMLISGRYYDGNCFCDWQDTSTGKITCESPCPKANCHVLRLC